jgi:hypothetical protein
MSAPTPTNKPSDVPFTFSLNVLQWPVIKNDTMDQDPQSSMIHHVKGFECLDGKVHACYSNKVIDGGQGLPHHKIKIIYIGADHHSNDCRSLFCFLSAQPLQQIPPGGQTGYPPGGQTGYPPGAPVGQQPSGTGQAYTAYQTPQAYTAYQTPQAYTAYQTPQAYTAYQHPGHPGHPGGLRLNLKEDIFLFNESLIESLGPIRYFTFHNELEEEAVVRIILGYVV